MSYKQQNSFNQYKAKIDALEASVKQHKAKVKKEIKAIQQKCPHISTKREDYLFDAMLTTCLDCGAVVKEEYPE